MPVKTVLSRLGGHAGSKTSRRFSGGASLCPATRYCRAQKLLELSSDTTADVYSCEDSPQAGIISET